MRARTLSQVAAAVGGRVVEADAHAQVRAVSIDSRTSRPGDLFVALAGERTDGHGFVEAAFEAGASAAMVSTGRGGPTLHGPIVEVHDTGRALMVLASAERDDLTASVVGITGSTGKTCTKDFARAVLGSRMPVAASPASFNNEIGLPLTILSATTETRALVCEMGARGAGHIRALCEVARPQIGVVTNVGLAHIGLFGSREAIAEAKAELIEALPGDGVAVLCADDPVVTAYADRTRARVLLFGLDAHAEVRAQDVSIAGTSGLASFVLVTPGGDARVTLRVPGGHMVANALAAAAVGWTLGVDPDSAAQALSAATVSAGRMEVFETPDGTRVVDDSYNANPASMAAALEAARVMAGAGRFVAVLGWMAELGSASTREHERLGELVARLRVDALVAVGEAAAPIAEAALRAGMDPGRILTCADAARATEAALELARPGDLVLIKASRVAGLDRVARALRRSSEQDPPAVVSPEAPAALEAADS